MCAERAKEHFAEIELAEDGRLRLTIHCPACGASPQAIVPREQAMALFAALTRAFAPGT